jgi:hypothetical protein
MIALMSFIPVFSGTPDPQCTFYATAAAGDRGLSAGTS